MLEGERIIEGERGISFQLLIHYPNGRDVWGGPSGKKQGASSRYFTGAHLESQSSGRSFTHLCCFPKNAYSVVILFFFHFPKAFK